MTREEYIEFANALKNNYTIDFDKLPEFCDMAISALSAEPCDDCISREAVLKLATPVDSMYADITVEMISADDVRKLPSILPITVDDSYMKTVRRDCGLYE